MKRRIPQSPPDWLIEIGIALKEAQKTQPLARIKDSDLYLLAPIVCLDFRGLDYRDAKLQRRVAEGAYAAYIASSGREVIGELLKTCPPIGFALCYVTSHVVLDLLDEEQAQAIMDHLVDQLDD